MMKKIFSFLLAALTLTAAFCEETGKVLSEEDFYSDWIIGTWIVENISESDGVSDNEKIEITVYGKTADSPVVMDGDYCSLKDLVDFLTSINTILGDGIDNPETAAALGLEVKGDFKMRAYEDYNLVKADVKITAPGHSGRIALIMTRKLSE